MPGKTVRTLIGENHAGAPGFDALRLILSLSILLFHSTFATYGYENSRGLWNDPVARPLLRALLPMFFFLSGFLVSGSAHRLRSTRTFLIFRVFRIMPALFVEVAISAVLLGAAVTEFSPARYYSDPGFFRYFLNTVGMVQFRLPGVFDFHPTPIVNINLWTLPAEFECYAIMAVFIFAGIIFNKKTFLFAFALGSLLLLALLPSVLDWGDMDRPFVRPTLLVYSFFVGAVCFVFSDRIIVKRSFLFLSIAGLAFFDWNPATIVGVLSACYLTLCIGFADLRRFPLIGRGDYSYGIYLYGFPIEQGLWHFFPSLRVWWALFLTAAPLTLGFSVFSWHTIEKPLLDLRRYVPRRAVTQRDLVPSP